MGLLLSLIPELRTLSLHGTFIRNRLPLSTSSIPTNLRHDPPRRLRRLSLQDCRILLPSGPSTTFGPTVLSLNPLVHLISLFEQVDDLSIHAISSALDETDGLLLRSHPYRPPVMPLEDGTDHNEILVPAVRTHTLSFQLPMIQFGFSITDLCTKVLALDGIETLSIAFWRGINLQELESALCEFPNLQRITLEVQDGLRWVPTSKSFIVPHRLPLF